NRRFTITPFYSGQSPELLAMPRPYVLLEANLRQLQETPPTVAVLPWGATEAHNYHLPHGCDVIEAVHIAERAAELAWNRGGRPIVLPAIPFGNDEQQLDQVCTISIRTPTALALLGDVVRSLKAQGIERLVLLNAHGGNQFQPLVRDLQGEYGLLIVVANFFQMAPQVKAETFVLPGDHADELETSLLLHLTPDWVELDQAGSGDRVPFARGSLGQPGVWTPRPWSVVHPDTGCGDPRRATAAKGAAYFEAVTEQLAGLLWEMGSARAGEGLT
ncbi:MAG: creatininase family protein, partial [Planctomycetales bacterium]|nr:creatininase family protein [Planctomycetales bacterium]